jgi:glyceraldehyde 3-phosphate dehydrogenase
MATKIAINGFGRIGRQILSGIKQFHRSIFDVVAINDITDTATNAHLFKFDSNYGRYAGTVEVADNDLVVDGDRIRVLAEKDPAALPWADLGVEIVFECTGKFTNPEKAAAHLQAGAKLVILSAPAKGGDCPTFVLGVNEEKFDPAKDKVISMASCTTNCLAPVAKVLNASFQIKRGFMTTIHSFTNDQNILDLPHKDLRRARAASLSMIPTSTGAAKAIGLVIPELKGKLHGLAIRVPTPTVSLVDLVCELGQSVTVEEVNNAMLQAAKGPLNGILAYETEELVSVDFKGNHHSSIFDAASTMVLDGNFVKVLSWYDNEWGYARRMGDFAAFVVKKQAESPAGVA